MIDYTIKFNYEKSLTSRKSYINGVLKTESVIYKIDSLNEIEYYLNHSDVLKAEINENYNRLEFLEKRTYDNDKRVIQKIMTKSDGYVVVTNYNFKDGKLISSEEKSTNCNKRLNLYKYFGDVGQDD